MMVTIQLMRMLTAQYFSSLCFDTIAARIYSINSLDYTHEKLPVGREYFLASSIKEVASHYFSEFIVSVIL